MKSTEIDEGLTLKTLVQLTGSPPHIIKYLTGLGRLPIIKDSAGAGYPRRYHRDAIKIVQEHLCKSGKYSSTDVDSRKPTE